MNLQQLKESVRELVGMNELAGGLNLLYKEIGENSPNYNTILQIRSRHHALGKEIDGGGMSSGTIMETRNGITSAILNLVSNLTPTDLIGTNAVDNIAAAKKMIPVFFSRGSHFNDVQKNYIELLKSKFESHGLELDTVEFSFENPLLPVRRRLKEVFGCVILALERARSPEFIEKQGSPKEKRQKDVWLPTPWIQMEAAMAYQQELPLLIFCEDKLKKEGMTEQGIHEFKIFEINPANPSELEDVYLSNVIETWARKVKEHSQKMMGDK